MIIVGENQLIKIHATLVIDGLHETSAAVRDTDPRSRFVINRPVALKQIARVYGRYTIHLVCELFPVECIQGEFLSRDISFLR